jgi:hypothetical protein
MQNAASDSSTGEERSNADRPVDEGGVAGVLVAPDGMQTSLRIVAGDTKSRPPGTLYVGL